MERLTQWLNGGVKCTYDQSKCEHKLKYGGCTCCEHMDAMMEKLAEYEDTEERIFKKLAGRLDTKKILNTFCSFYEAQTQHENLEKAVLVARSILGLPCKLRDVRYMCFCGEIYPFEVRGIETDKYGQLILLRYGGELEELLFWEFLAGFPGVGVDVEFFRTREEAERALKRRKDGEINNK